MATKREELNNPMSCLNSARSDEPLFVLKANDENAPDLVHDWVKKYVESKGGTVEWNGGRYVVAGKLTAAQVAKANEASQLAIKMVKWKAALGKGELPCKPPELALDVSLEETRALHRVWRALNDGDCPACHTYVPATSIIRINIGHPEQNARMECPSCGFYVTEAEIADIERKFSPAMDMAVDIFLKYRASRQ